MTFDDELIKLFESAVDVNDTIWYSKHETLYEAIVSLHHKYDRR